MKRNLSKVVLLSLAVLLLAAGCSKNSTQNNQAQQISEIKVSQSVEGGKPLEVITLKPDEHKTALDILKASYKVQTKSFGDAGEFVEAINGKLPDKTHFWSFYVNGKQSNVGASTYELKNEDSIEWKLEEIKK